MPHSIISDRYLKLNLAVPRYPPIGLEIDEHMFYHDLKLSQSPLFNNRIFAWTWLKADSSQLKTQTS
jgi:hypothetical protein